jgi:hypothetical protein
MLHVITCISSALHKCAGGADRCLPVVYSAIVEEYFQRFSGQPWPRWLARDEYNCDNMGPLLVKT